MPERDDASPGGTDPLESESASETEPAEPTPSGSGASTPPEPGRGPSDSEVACFEAGVKFGSLYHQFAGTPVSPASADSLATAMEEAIENQPHCTDVTVAVREDALEAAVADGPADYTELTGRYLDVDIRVDYGGHAVHARMRMDDGYPLMEVHRVESE